MSKEITQERLREILNYDADTGIFIWITTGRIAKCKNTFGYIVIRIGGKLFYAHRLAWLWMTGEWPLRIDHKDRDPANNKFSNLRQATSSQNGVNKTIYSNNSSGVRGVHWNKINKNWRAKVNYGGNATELGSHKRFCEAIKARRAAEIAVHGEFSPRFQ